MFCPKCGTQNPDNSLFCRSCGANLSNVLAVVNGELSPQAGLDSENSLAHLQSSGIRNTILGGGFIVVSIFLKSLPGDTSFWLLFMIAAVCLIASGVSRIIKAEALKESQTKKSLTPPSNPALSVSPTAKELPSTSPDYVSSNSLFKTNELPSQPVSVTEGTTRNLEKNEI
jgi:hypothetical protein